MQASEDWDRHSPPDTIEWVDEEMAHVQKKYVMYNKHEDTYGDIVFTEGQYTMNEGEDYNDKEDAPEKVEYQDVSVCSGDHGLHTVGDDHVFYKQEDAEELGRKLAAQFGSTLGNWRGVILVHMKHGGGDWGSACYLKHIERGRHGDWLRGVNNLGLVVFVRRDILERENIKYFKHSTSSVIGHTNGGNSENPDVPPNHDDGEAEDSGDDL